MLGNQEKRFAYRWLTIYINIKCLWVEMYIFSDETRQSAAWGGLLQCHPPPLVIKIFYASTPPPFVKFLQAKKTDFKVKNVP